MEMILQKKESGSFWVTLKQLFTLMKSDSSSPPDLTLGSTAENTLLFYKSWWNVYEEILAIWAE